MKTDLIGQKIIYENEFGVIRGIYKKDGDIRLIIEFGDKRLTERWLFQVKTVKG